MTKRRDKKKHTQNSNHTELRKLDNEPYISPGYKLDWLAWNASVCIHFRKTTYSTFNKIFHELRASIFCSTFNSIHFIRQWKFFWNFVCHPLSVVSHNSFKPRTETIPFCCLSFSLNATKYNSVQLSSTKVLRILSSQTHRSQFTIKSWRQHTAKEENDEK